jgi:hypothetical protein
LLQDFAEWQQQKLVQARHRLESGSGFDRFTPWFETADQAVQSLVELQEYVASQRAADRFPDDLVERAVRLHQEVAREIERGGVIVEDAARAELARPELPLDFSGLSDAPSGKLSAKLSRLASLCQRGNTAAERALAAYLFQRRQENIWQKEQLAAQHLEALRAVRTGSPNGQVRLAEALRGLSAIEGNARLLADAQNYRLANDYKGVLDSVRRMQPILDDHGVSMTRQVPQPQPQQQQRHEPDPELVRFYAAAQQQQQPHQQQQRRPEPSEDQKRFYDNAARQVVADQQDRAHRSPSLAADNDPTLRQPVIGRDSSERTTENAPDRSSNGAPPVGQPNPGQPNETIASGRGAAGHPLLHGSEIAQHGANWAFYGLAGAQLVEAVRTGDKEKAREAAVNAGVLVGAGAAPKVVQSAVATAGRVIGVGSSELTAAAGLAGRLTGGGLGGYFTVMSAYATYEARQAFNQAAGEITRAKADYARSRDRKDLERGNAAWDHLADATYQMFTNALDTGAAGLATTSAGLAITGVGAGAAVGTGLGAVGLTAVSAANHVSAWLCGEERTRQLGYKILKQFNVTKSDYDGLPAGQRPATGAPTNSLPRPGQESLPIAAIQPTAPTGPETTNRGTPAGRQVAALYHRGDFDDFAPDRLVSQSRTPAEQAAARRWLPQVELNEVQKVAV